MYLLLETNTYMVIYLQEYYGILITALPFYRLSFGSSVWYIYNVTATFYDDYDSSTIPSADIVYNAPCMVNKPCTNNAVSCIKISPFSYDIQYFPDLFFWSPSFTRSSYCINCRFTCPKLAPCGLANINQPINYSSKTIIRMFFTRNLIFWTGKIHIYNL